MTAIVDQYGAPLKVNGHRSRSVVAERRGPARRPIEAKYDLAQTTDQNSAHWANADALDADTANSLAVRKRLRERARYEFANNGYLRGIVRTLANHEVGIPLLRTSEIRLIACQTALRRLKWRLRFFGAHPFFFGVLGHAQRRPATGSNPLRLAQAAAIGYLCNRYSPFARGD